MDETNEAPLSSQLKDALQKTCTRMGVFLEEERAAALCVYIDELARWNRAYNLVGRRVGTQGMIDLCVDAITPLCIKGLFGEEKEVLDIGCGAGMPGIPLYILAGPFPLTLVEPQRKKVTFLRHIRRKMGLEGISIYPGRVEAMARDDDHLNAYETAMARAVTDPLRLARMAEPLLCEGGQLVLFAGEKDAGEIRRYGASLEAKGLRVQATRSTKRLTSRDCYLVQLVKTRPHGMREARSPGR
ncbi:MAG: 16S rRNA (guanine(527)-N(7))-methyltransferase RsmG [Actinobacteria bacterium]|nr:16S rRNA (guanine(527)-N(7))-methyltransferase RsmG [Actinomycetota bacterium]MDI6830760.1 16S rRNA (guanine(527)-N(7))-methyltransferase RsmG [Actinomycetota bacterium]